MAWQDVPDRRWSALLEIFRDSTPAVQAAVRWVETQGYGGALGTASTQGNARGVLQSLSRFVPDLLAKPVVVIEEQDDNLDAAVSVCNHLWIETLPSAMQTDILTFLTAERRHFLSKDLVALASALLASRDTDFWVRFAATKLLSIQNGESNHHSLFLGHDPTLSQKLALEEYDSLPSWLEEYKRSESVLLSDLSLRQEDASTKNGDETQVQAEKEINSGGDKVVHIGGDQEEFPVPRSRITSQTSILGKGEHDLEPGVDLQHALPDIEVQEAPGEIMPGRENVETACDEDESAAKEVLGDDLFLRAKILGVALRSSHLGLPSDIDMISRAANSSLVLKVVKPWLADDETTSLLVGALLGEQSGYAQSTQIISHVLLPKLTTMQEPPSRMLGSAVVQAGKAHPRATVDTIIIPLLLHTEAGSTVKCDLINRVVKECFSPEAASSLCNRLFCPRTEEEKLRSWVWTEGTVGVVHTLLSQKVTLEEAALEGLISSLERYCNQFSASLKFSNLLLTLVTKFGPQVRPFKAALQQVASSTKTFLTKSILAKVTGL